MSAKTRRSERAFPGVGKRLTRRLTQIGYQRADGTPDVGRFCEEKTFPSQQVYRWLNETTTPGYAYLQRLAKALDAPMAWILLGMEAVDEIHEHELRHSTGSKRERRRSLRDVLGD